jgi:hypothetical protein
MAPIVVLTVQALNNYVILCVPSLFLLWVVALHWRIFLAAAAAQ